MDLGKDLGNGLDGRGGSIGDLGLGQVLRHNKIGMASPPAGDLIRVGDVIADVVGVERMFDDKLNGHGEGSF